MTSPSRSATGSRYPVAERLDLIEDLHGHRVADPYRWLEDVEDPRTRAWSQAQDELVAEFAEHWPGREGITRRLGELLGSGVVGVPVWRGERRFFIRREGGQEMAVLYVQDGDAERRVLLDPMVLDPTGLTTLDAWQPDREGTLLAYQLSAGGTEESVLRVIDVVTGELVDGPIDRARYSPVSWVPGGLPGESPGSARVPAYYYVRRLAPELVPADEQQYHRRIWLHRVGADPATDVEIFGEGHDPRTYFGVGLSRDGRWLTVSASVGTAPRNDVWIADLAELGTDQAGGSADRAAPAFRPVATGLDAQTGAYVGRDGRLYIVTDLAAPRGRLAVTDPSTPQPEHWRDLIAHDPEAVLEDFTILDGPELETPLLLAGWTRHAISEITVHDLDSGAQLPGERGRIELPGIGSVGRVALPGRRVATRPGSATPTTSLRRTSSGWTGGPASTSCSPSRPARSRCRPSSPGRWSTPRRTGRRCGCSSPPAPTCSARTTTRSPCPARPSRGRPFSTATAVSTCR